MKQRAAFTLVEVLIAMAFLAVITPVLVQALSVSSAASVASERGGLATQLAENMLNELLLDDAWSSGTDRGDFGENWPGYRWELENNEWQPATGMTELTMVVYFAVQGNERSVRISTLTPTTPITSDTEEAAAP